MKAGDKVIVRDCSYSHKVVNGSLQRVQAWAKGPQFTVVAVRCYFPNPHRFQIEDGHYNNTVIQKDDSGEVVFIEERFLIPVKHTIRIDGKDIEISNESFQELKRTLGVN